jgi:hypothetical protein
MTALAASAAAFSSVVAYVAATNCSAACSMAARSRIAATRARSASVTRAAIRARAASESRAAAVTFAAKLWRSRGCDQLFFIEKGTTSAQVGPVKCRYTSRRSLSDLNTQPWTTCLLPCCSERASTSGVSGNTPFGVLTVVSVSVTLRTTPIEDSLAGKAAWLQACSARLIDAA